MPKSHDPDRLTQGLSLGDDTLVAEAEAEVLRRLANGEGVDPTRFRDDGPDPLGTDWAWAGGEKPAPPSSVGPERPTPEEVRPVGRGVLRRFGYALGAATAAGLLIGLGMLVAGVFRDRGPETFVLNVEPTRIQLFGTEQPQPTVTSPFPGFVAAVGVTAAGDVHVWPTEGDRPGRPIPILKGATIPVGPLPAAVERVVVVVTEQPATAALLQAFGREKLPAEGLTDVEQRVTAALRGLNYRNLATGSVKYPPLP